MGMPALLGIRLISILFGERWVLYSFRVPVGSRIKRIISSQTVIGHKGRSQVTQSRFPQIKSRYFVRDAPKKWKLIPVGLPAMAYHGTWRPCFNYATKMPDLQFLTGISNLKRTKSTRKRLLSVYAQFCSD